MARSRKSILTLTVAAGVFVSSFGAAVCVAQKRDLDTLVRRDRDATLESKLWLYNNLDEGVEAAKRSGKPIIVVFR